MKLYSIIFSSLLVAARANALGGDMSQPAASPNGGSISPSDVTASSITINGTGSQCFSADNPTLVVDCGNHRVGISTNTPHSALDVVGQSTFRGSSTLLLSSFTATGTNAQTIGIQRVNSVGATSEPGVFEVRAPNGSAANTVWGSLVPVVLNATSGSEASYWAIRSQVGGVSTDVLQVGNNGVVTSSAVFIGVSVSTIVAGAGGASVTALCPSGKFAMGGGCLCTGGIALTGQTSVPNCVTAGCIPSGWTCQEPGGTGGACSAYAICSRAQ